MLKWWIIWFISLPIFLITYIYSFFITSKIAYAPQSECKPLFIFTPQNVQYCSDIYPIDLILIALKTNPTSYLCIASGLYLVGFLLFVGIRLILKFLKLKK
ncbi:hypothetical protein JOC86_001177 [Bacillus pakistanensis]|uniref:DUF4306 domain-containing protein n=1 Tax=Rossellomorea pakistanensis TaxID=992288 RepID=A0ABS2NA18_9BACI|nr:hypothetical protein [Bacillus pakistanensis]